MGNGQSNFDYRNCPPATTPWAIDPTKLYPDAYKEFMTTGCYFDEFGNMGGAFEDSMITEAQVGEILERRARKALEKKTRHLKLMEENLAKEMKEWDRMFALAKDEINTFDINTKDAYGSVLRK